MSSTPARSCSSVALCLERKPEVVHHAQERLDRTLDGVVAGVRALLRLALAGVLKLGLQPRQPIHELVAFAAGLLELRTKPAPASGRIQRLLPASPQLAFVPAVLLQSLFVLHRLFL